MIIHAFAVLVHFLLLVKNFLLRKINFVLVAFLIGCYLMYSSSIDINVVVVIVKDICMETIHTLFTV
ncbi:hypothetical protein AQUCO_00600292v1 [Aquilegia coerulea]|uniref:Uncharacterized protein n=1 Tax=Aquilegia coerulea TaxID=218851 RepID=A0A2G5EP32_AQUCA|nr:hypothetical protein AQUCO_00600292v1 [Aquilegia coerulea]